MASEKLINAVNSYEEHIKVHGITEDSIKAYVIASNAALMSEKDVEYGLKLTARAKELIFTMVKDKTGGDIWALEAYCEQNKVTYSLVELYYMVLKLESYWKLESFTFYMERNRPQVKRFYLPRRKTLGIVVQDLEELRKRTIKHYCLSMPPRVGKALADYTPVLTKKGWKNHGDLVAGDYVLGRNYEWVKVLQIHPKGYANKRVWFADGTYIDCHENHEWLVYDRSRNCERIAETKELVNSEYREGEKTRYRYFIPNSEVADYIDIELPMNPYVLGVWLGDGTNTKGAITCCNTDTNILLDFSDAGYKLRHIWKQTGCNVYDYKGLQSDLQRLGMCHSNKRTQKHIPEIYLTASKHQRLELLAGLIDTDGCLRKKENRYDISTSDKVLRDNIIALISTFGWRVCVTEKEPCMSTGGIEGRKTNYRIFFNPTFEIPCRVERKQLTTFSEQRRIAIERVEEIEPTQCNCITVEGGLYRVGNSLKLTHNSTICIFYLAWSALRSPNAHSAMGGHSGLLAKGFYKELLNLMTTDEYTFAELYEFFHPGHEIIRDKSAEEYTVTLDEPDRFATITCRGIDGTWTGAIDVSDEGDLYVDDLVRDREHSLSPSRMENTWQEYLNKMVDRMHPGSGELDVGTLWSVLDPIARLKAMYGNDPRYRFREIPALDENDESNFDYDFGVGFTTEYYREMRNKLDNAEWMAKYQQKPYVREGLLFPTDELRYFNGILPDGDSRVVAVCDVAYGGGDSLSMPVGIEYENGDVYIIDWIHSPSPKEITIPRVVGAIIGNEIREIVFEGNQGGDLYCGYVDAELRKQRYKCSCSSRRAPNTMAKKEKIVAYSGDIKRKFIFLQPQKPTVEELEADARLGITRYVRSSEYQKAMDEFCTFVTIGKNEHDDATDAVTQLAMKIDGYGSLARVEVIDNPMRSGRY